MTKHATLSAVLLMGLLTAACTSTSGVSLSNASSSSPSGSVVASTASTPRPEATTSQPVVAPVPQPPGRPSPGPNQCPGITANPVGCPVSLPPQPIGPQTGHARILLCSQPIIVVAPPNTIRATVCGTGFRPEELVTITVTGRMGSTSWQVTARSDGTFRSGIPSGACRLMPAYATARGNHGSVSNAVPLNLLACRT